MIPRHTTALSRVGYSKPIRLALQDALITPSGSVLDYGCGRGSDVARLCAAGFQCRGWDPQHANETPPTRADIVNLGYVINVIEDAAERREALSRAWSLTQSVLIVTARMTYETLGQVLATYGDGVLTTRGTFQKFYDHAELRDWIAGDARRPCSRCSAGYVLCVSRWCYACLISGRSPATCRTDRVCQAARGAYRASPHAFRCHSAVLLATRPPPEC